MDASPQASPQISKLSLSKCKSIFPQSSAKGTRILRSLHQLWPSVKLFCSHICVCVSSYGLRPCKMQWGTGRLWLNLEYGTREECHIVIPVIVQQWQDALCRYTMRSMSHKSSCCIEVAKCTGVTRRLRLFLSFIVSPVIVREWQNMSLADCGPDLVELDVYHEENVTRAQSL